MSFSEGKYCKVNRTVFSMENRLFSYRKTNKKKNEVTTAQMQI